MVSFHMGIPLDHYGSILSDKSPLSLTLGTPGLEYPSHEVVEGQASEQRRPTKFAHRCFHSHSLNMSASPASVSGPQMASRTAVAKALGLNLNTTIGALLLGGLVSAAWVLRISQTTV